MKYGQKLANGSIVEITKEEAEFYLQLAVTYQTEILAERFPGREPEFTTIEEAHQTLVANGSLNYDDDWYATIYAKEQGQEPQESAYSRKLDCGHIVHSPTLVMQTSYSGTACPDCYDLIESQGYAYKR